MQKVVERWKSWSIRADLLIFNEIHLGDSHWVYLATLAHVFRRARKALLSMRESSRSLASRSSSGTLEVIIKDQGATNGRNSVCRPRSCQEAFTHCSARTQRQNLVEFQCQPSYAQAGSQNGFGRRTRLTPASRDSARGWSPARRHCD